MTTSLPSAYQRRLAVRIAGFNRSALSQPLGVVGFLISGAWVLVAALAPLISPYDPIVQHVPFFQTPSADHIFGTDELGRDLYSRVLWGARISIPLAVLLVVGIVLIGGSLGAIAGYFGGYVDVTIMRVADLIFAFPVILWGMLVVAALGPGLKNVVLAVMLVAWPSYARLVRGLVTSITKSDYISASRLLGASTLRALVVDALPNIAGPVVVLAALDIGKGVLLLSALSFLGLGAQPPTPEWGSMVASGTHYVDHWWLGLFPGLAIFSVVLGFSFLGDSLRDALDPKSSWSGGGRAS